MAACSAFTRLALLLAASCATAEAPREEIASEVGAAITNGSIARADPAVVGLVAGGRVGCTGVLVGPRLVLTAAHCIDGALPEAALVGLSPDEGARVGLSRRWVHPDHSLGSPEHDVGLLLLAAPLQVAAPALSAAPLSEADVGRQVRVVGFGAREGGGGEPGEPIKMQGSAVLRGVAPGTLILAPAPSQPCAGDSGGPVLGLAGGREVVLGIVSQGDEGCDEHAQAARVDVELEGFIEPLREQAEATAGATGERCVLPENCASNLCLSPGDAPEFAYCSRACAGPADCPEGMECAADSGGQRACQHPRPSPGALGAACADHGGCQSGLCASFADSAAKQCSALCFPEDAEPCPRGGACLPLVGVEGASGCALDGAAPQGERDEPGGCAVGWIARPPQRGHAFVLLALCALALGRARRRAACQARRRPVALARSMSRTDCARSRARGTLTPRRSGPMPVPTKIRVSPPSRSSSLI